MEAHSSLIIPIGSGDLRQEAICSNLKKNTQENSSQYLKENIDTPVSSFVIALISLVKMFVA